MNLFKKIFIIFAIIAVIALILFMFAGCGNQAVSEQRDGDINNNNNIDAFAPDIGDATTGQGENNENTDIDTDENEHDKGGDLRYKDGFAFVYNGYDIYMGAIIESVIAEIGPQSDYYVSDSCTSDGIMHTYCYNGVEIYTYELNLTENVFRIFSIGLIDDSNSTAEGIYIGQTVDEMIAAYGGNYEYEAIFGSYKYTKSGTELIFDVDGDIIISIMYMLINV